MEVVANNFLPGDQRLVDQIVYELKAQGIFDQFRKECFADVDTKPAYQNLRQRVEGSVTGFLKEQSWRPDMNKNQVREMLRKRITESGYLETGVERIVDQVVNPKINTVFLSKVEEVVYSFLGIKKPMKIEAEVDLLPTDLEAVSPESEPVDKKDDKSADTLPDLEESKMEEDESPPFEPLEEQPTYLPPEENSIDSHISGFSGLGSHESNQSNENKVGQVEQDSQISRNSSESRLSIVTSDENSKMDICEDSQSKSVKLEDKNKHKSGERHKSRSESKTDRDRKSSKDSKSRHSSSSKDTKEKSRDRKDSKSCSKDKPREREKNDIDRSRSSRDRKESSSRDKDKSRHKSSDSRSKGKSSSSSSSDKHKHSSSSHSDRYKKDKDRKKEKSKDDHYSSKDKRIDRRSTDRDSNDGFSNKQNSNTSSSESISSKNQKASQESLRGSGDNGNSESVENMSITKAPVNISEVVENSEITITSPDLSNKVKVFKPKCASNLQEALRLKKIRKQLAKLEKKNQLSLASVDVNAGILASSSINLDEIKVNGHEEITSTVITQDNWDAMEAKMREEVDDEEDCKYFEIVDLGKIEFLLFIKQFNQKIEKNIKPNMRSACKRKIDDDFKNNNNNSKKSPIVQEKKRKITRNNNKIDAAPNGKFLQPLSPVESDKKEENAIKSKRNSISKVSSQRYSSDDLYKPRPSFLNNSRRRGAKNPDN